MATWLVKGLLPFKHRILVVLDNMESPDGVDGSERQVYGM